MDVEPDEKVVAVAVALVDAVEGKLGERFYRDRRVAVLGVHHLPVARGDLGKEREDGVPEAPPRRHPLPIGLVDEAVALRVVGPPLDDRVEEGWKVGRVHLVVTGHHRGDVHSILDRPLVTGGDRRPDAPVRAVVDRDDPWIAPGVVLDDLPGPVGGAVVHRVDFRDVVGDAVEHLPDQLFLVVRRDHHGDPPPPVAGFPGLGPLALRSGDLQVMVMDQGQDI